MPQRPDPLLRSRSFSPDAARADAKRHSLFKNVKAELLEMAYHSLTVERYILVGNYGHKTPVPARIRSWDVSAGDIR